MADAQPFEEFLMGARLSRFLREFLRYVRDRIGHRRPLPLGEPRIVREDGLDYVRFRGDQ